MAQRDDRKLRAQVPGVPPKAATPESGGDEAREAKALGHRQAAFAELQVGFVEDAVASLEKAAALEPEQPRSHANLGVVAKASGRFDEAERHYRQALEVSPEDPETLYNLGNLYWSQGRKAEAVAAFERTLRVRPRHAEALNSLGVARIDAGDLLAAVALFEEALAAKPDYAGARGNLANAYLLDGQPQRALPHYEAALAESPGDGRLRLKRVQALLLLERYDEALAACREAIDAGLRDGELAVIAAAILDQKGQTALADETFRLAGRVGLQSANGHYRMGLFLLRRGQKIETAAGHFHRAVTLEPDHFEAMLGLAQACARSGRRDKAAAMLRRILALKSGHGLTARRLEAVQAEARAYQASLMPGAIRSA